MLRRVCRADATSNFLAMIPFDDSNVVLALEIEPELRAVAEVRAEPDCCMGTDRPAPVEDVGDATLRHTEIDGQTVGAQVSCGKFAL